MVVWPKTECSTCQYSFNEAKSSFESQIFCPLKHMGGPHVDMCLTNRSDSSLSFLSRCFSAALFFFFLALPAPAAPLAAPPAASSSSSSRSRLRDAFSLAWRATASMRRQMRSYTAQVSHQVGQYIKRVEQSKEVISHPAA